jgi:hypothetical protein
MHSQPSPSMSHTGPHSDLRRLETKRKSLPAFPRTRRIGAILLVGLVGMGLVAWAGEEKAGPPTCPPAFASCLTEAEARHNLKLFAELESLRKQVKILKGGSFLKRHFSLGAAVGPTAVFCQDVGEGSACVGVTVGISVH